jgi:hypothetical protein
VHDPGKQRSGWSRYVAMRRLANVNLLLGDKETRCWLGSRSMRIAVRIYAHVGRGSGTRSGTIRNHT